MAVLAVLGFHAGVLWLPGGFLGVSTFFTLSGFLITSLLLDEWEREGRIALGAFWARRARRLLPAALICLVAILAYGYWLSDPTTRASLRSDVLAALVQVANWRFVFDGRSYADIFVEPSPVLHYWSLAIEEQAYLLLPLLLAGVLGSRWFGRRGAVALVSLMALGSATALWLTASSGNLTLAYYGTHTRGAELLWGAAAALALGPLWRSPGERAARLVRLAAWPALAVIIWLWSVASTSDLWVYQLALPLYPLLSLLLVLAACRGGSLSRLLGWEPLALLGRVSYGVYLYHWPVFLWLSPRRTGLDDPWLLLLRLAVTAALVAASYNLIEWPIRRGVLLRPRPLQPARVLSLGGTPALILVTALLVGSTSEPLPAYLAEPSSAPPPPRSQSAADPAAPTTVPERGRVEVEVIDRPLLLEPLRVLIVGDSVATSLGIGLSEWGEERGLLEVWNTGTPGCGIVRGGEIRAAGRTGPAPAGCEQWPELYAARVEEFEPHLVVVLVGAWDAADHLLVGDDTWRGPGDPLYDSHIRSEVSEVARILTGGDGLVVWLSYPYITLSRYPGLDPRGQYNEAIRERMDVINAIVREALAEVEGALVVDLAGYLDGWPGGQLDPELRPDGVHFGTEGTRDVAEWLGPLLVELAGYRMVGFEGSSTG